jgi:hypothetical protein
MNSMTLKEILGLGVLGALVSTVGTLLGLYLKDFVAARAFERWKARRAADDVFRRYRDPLALATSELINRLCEIISQEHPSFLKADVLKIANPRIERNDEEDPYFRRYKYDSTIYRLASVLGWIELFRQDITFLDSGQMHKNVEITNCLGDVRAALADGHLNEAADWAKWRDYLIFREEQRAIGESMIDNAANPRRVKGYDRFLADNAERPSRWFMCLAGFFEDLETSNRDYRMIRIKRLLVALAQLLTLTSERSLSERVHKEVAKCANELDLPLPAAVMKAAL